MTLLYACEQAVTDTEVESNGCPCALDTLPYTLDELIDSATDTLYLLSGGVVTGRCQRTVRPCKVYCSCGGYCACCVLHGIELPGVRVVVDQVKVDGAIVSPTDYTIVDGFILAKRDGTSWPYYQNILLPDTADNTFSIKYTSGLAFDFVSRMAAIELVCEMALFVTGERTRLPKGTVSATSDGVQVVVSRLPGREDLEVVGLTWLGRFLTAFGVQANTEVRSPELSGGWKLSTVA